MSESPTLELELDTSTEVDFWVVWSPQHDGTSGKRYTSREEAEEAAWALTPQLGPLYVLHAVSFVGRPLGE